MILLIKKTIEKNLTNNINHFIIFTLHGNENRRIDIITFFGENNFIIGIKNKIYENTQDQHKQIEKKHFRTIIIWLNTLKIRINQPSLIKMKMLPGNYLNKHHSTFLFNIFVHNVCT